MPDQDRNCALRFSSGRRARERRGGRRDFLIVALVGCCAHCQEYRTQRQRGNRGQLCRGGVRSGWRRLAAEMACGRTGSGCQGTQHYSPVPRSRAAIRMPVNRARLWRHAGSWSRVRSLRHRGQTRRRAISAWLIRMAVPQPPQAMTTGSMASLVSRVCLKEFVEGVLFSLAACSACAKPVARIAVGHGQLVTGAG